MKFYNFDELLLINSSLPGSYASESHEIIS